MEYKEIVAVTGMGGLFQLMATKNDGAIVRNLADKTTKFISARLHNITPLDSIEIFTTGANVRLHEVLEELKNKEAKQPLVDHKKASNDEVKSYLKEVYPDIDEERVYVSDMRKMLRWFEILKSNDLLDFKQEEEEEELAADAEAATEEPSEKKPKAKKEKGAEEKLEEAKLEEPANNTVAAKKKNTTAPKDVNDAADKAKDIKKKVVKKTAEGDGAAAPKKTAAKKAPAKKKAE